MSLPEQKRMSQSPDEPFTRNRLYQGQRHADRRVTVTVDGQPLRHVVRHSPDGFDWGRRGSGPADLALALLTDAAGDQLADMHYQALAADIVSRLNDVEWMLTRAVVVGWLQRHVAAEQSRRTRRQA